MANYCPSPSPKATSSVTKVIYGKTQPSGGTGGGSPRPASNQMYPRTK